eukprot:Selendium_serpulae@DN4635_c0_g2_i1.p2
MRGGPDGSRQINCTTLRVLDRRIPVRLAGSPDRYYRIGRLATDPALRHRPVRRTAAGGAALTTPTLSHTGMGPSVKFIPSPQKVAKYSGPPNTSTAPQNMNPMGAVPF